MVISLLTCTSNILILYVYDADIETSINALISSIIETCVHFTCLLQVAAQGTRTPFSSPAGEQRGGLG